MKFRTLNANEIECRVNTITEKGCSVLLYKDARADMNLLDETVGPENWERKHELINGNLFCTVSINCDGRWVSKQDVGKESNTEAEKGQASDAFKRACVNWGIGRELYSSPFVWIADVNIVPKGQKFTTYDRFKVKSIAYDDARNIKSLEIINEKTKKVVFSWGDAPKIEPQKPAVVSEAEQRARVLKFINNNENPKAVEEYIKEKYKVDPKGMNPKQVEHFISVMLKNGKEI